MLKLVKEFDPVLKQVAVDWDFTVDKSAEGAAILEKQMIDLMQSFNGIGLAANQVGLLYRVFVIKLNGREPVAMFNPKVIGESADLFQAEEGCLSFPNLWLDVKRPKAIQAEYLDNTGKSCTIELTGIDARCFLHELDHLNGVTFTQKVSVLKLAMARKRQQKKRKYNG